MAMRRLCWVCPWHNSCDQTTARCTASKSAELAELRSNIPEDHRQRSFEDSPADIHGIEDPRRSVMQKEMQRKTDSGPGSVEERFELGHEENLLSA